MENLNLYNFKEVIQNDVKNIVLNIIYQKLNINNFRYQLLDQKNMDILKSETFFITPHIIGLSCWIIFIEIANIKYQYIILKKDLKQYRNQINFLTFKLYTFNCDQNTNAKLYPLTVFDGRFINNGKGLTYIIQDMYIYAPNNNILIIPLNEKYKIIEQLLHSLNKNLDNNFDIKLCGLYTYDMLGDLIFNKIKNSKFKINGFIFLPNLSGKTIIYVNDIDFNTLRVTPMEQISKKYNTLSIPNIPLKMNNINHLDTQLINEFVIRKTNISDVFEIYKYINKTDNKLYLNVEKDNYIGICHIPDIKTSHYCKIKGNQYDIFLNKCIYNNKFKKWCPVIE